MNMKKKRNKTKKMAKYLKRGLCATSYMLVLNGMESSESKNVTPPTNYYNECVEFC